MKDYKCKCGNTTDFFIEHNSSQCGLYCGECGKWQKWLNKDEERLFKHKQDLTNHDKQVRDEVKTCDGCKHNGKWENEIEYGYNSPCTLCRRRCLDNYEADERGTE